ncbi:MAG TPA: Hpt domain-containing protein [Ktedonosporobacter sp.]|nr:Hpt domain-containing protein [Ktedonosporobacter sp.]
MSNTSDKLSILDSFIEEVNTYLPEIEKHLERLAHSPADMDALEETYRLTHTIGGSASMMDFPGLAHVAHGMEDILGDVLEAITPLDEPTLGLLQRSLGRLHLLLQGVRNGSNPDAIIAEDDADFAQYQARFGAVPQSSVGTDAPGLAFDDAQIQGGNVSGSPSFDFSSSSSSSSLPSFDEVLASFRTPSVSPGENVAWPEEPASHFENPAAYAWQAPPETLQQPPSALETLVASTRQPSTPPTPPVDTTWTPPAHLVESALPPAQVHDEPFDASVSPSAWGVPSTQFPDEQFSLSTPFAAPVARNEPALPDAYQAAQQDAQTLAAQASSLKHVVTQLRSAMSVIEVQRGEFKNFLDGSKDALDRMEDWAGQAMGLNLRNSPDQVRRYLPLSVMWVTNKKLKKVLDLLQHITGGVELTDEHMAAILQQLHASIASCGDAFAQVQNQSSHFLRQESGWSSWQMQTSADTLRERVTFERHGDLEAVRDELEARLREEIRHEYEDRPIPHDLRAELEQQIRSEVRQEFEAQQRLRERVSGPMPDESQQEMESRLRNEIEIQVRQEFLSQITSVEAALPSRPTSAPTTSNFADRASESTGVSAMFPSLPPTLSTPMAAPARPQSTIPSPFGADFGEEAAEIFRAEAEEHLQTISVHVAALEKSPGNRELIQGIRRATHTLKGAAGMMGFRAIADLCHVSEDLLDSIMEENTPITAMVVSLILDTAEALETLILGNVSSADDAKVQAVRARYVELFGEHSPSASSVDDDLDVSDDQDIDSSHLTSVVAAGGQETNAQRAARGDLSVRVRLQKLDELVNLFGEMLVNRSVLEERIQRLVRLVADVGVSSNRLRDVGQKLESRFEAATLPSGRSLQVMPGEGDKGIHRNNNQQPVADGVSKSYLAEFDELELDRYTEFHQLARGLSEGISDMTTLSTEMDTAIRECEGVFARENRLNTTFQDHLMKVRLVPLVAMTPRLYRAARAVALKQHKDFDFILEGEDTEVDRTVFEEISGPLLHLMRNAANHAIETPEVRMQKGKSPKGQIKLSAAYEGNQIVITVRDDGMGIDPERVRRTAIEHGLIRPDQHLSEGDVIDLIFRPGFSTAEVLSEESGRGVGLDVVRDSVSRLRGTLAVESTPGQGTAFTMTFPTSLAIQSAMMIRVGGQQFAIPTVAVESIGRLDNFKRITVAGQPAVQVQNDHYPLRMLAPYLSLPATSLEEKAQLLLVNAAGQRVALVVEEIRGKADIVMKNLGPHLRQVHGIAGGTVLGNGRVVLVLELNDLLTPRQKIGTHVATAVQSTVRRENQSAPAPQTSVRQRVDILPGTQSVPARPTPAAAAPIPERGKHILVVDDSPSVRRVVANMLKQHNWEVQMARDGVEASEMISYETPAAVLLDIEMPRMDGFELISTVRAQEQYRTLPLVVLTSRAGSKHQQRAMLLGASAYVIKPYQDEDLINTLNTLVYGAPIR